MSETKALTGVEIKDADKGQVQAVFSTFDVIDSDGDVTQAGAFEDGASVRMSAYGHASWVGALPIGRGVIRADEKQAVLDGQFFLGTTHGRDTFETVKEMGDLQEWSYGYDAETDDGDFEGQAVRFLRKLKVHEVSPVLIGAGVDTRTLSVKGKQLQSELFQRLQGAGRERFGADKTYVWAEDFDLDEGWVIYAISAEDEDTRLLRVSYTRDDAGNVSLGPDEAEVQRTTSFAPKAGRRFADDVDQARAQVVAIVERSRSLVGLRAKEGRVLSAANRERLSSLLSALTETAQALEVLLTESDPDKHRTALLREIARYERLRAGL